MKLLSSPTELHLRPWEAEDAPFTIVVRNHPDLMKWFRQDENLILEDQIDFIKRDRGPWGHYNGNIIEADGEPVGLCGVKATREFTIAILPEHQGRGIAAWVMHQMTQNTKEVWSEVFVGNPALEFFIAKCGFRIVAVKERAYYKKQFGLVDIVRIQHE